MISSTRAPRIAINRLRLEEAEYADVEARVEWIDRETAERYLQHDIDNYRKEIPTNKRRIRSDMVSNRFGLSPDCLAFTKSGVLFNGRHRLQCVAETGVRSPFLVARGFPDKCLHATYVDRGSKRSASTDLQHAGVKNPVAQAAAARILAKLKRSLSSDADQHNAISDCGVNELVQRAPDLVRYVAEAGNKVVPDSVLGVWRWLASQEDAELAEHAFNVFIKKEEASSSHMFSVVREHFLQAKTASHKLRVRFGNDFVLRSLMHAWEHFKAGTSVKNFRTPKELRLSTEARQAMENLLEGIV